PRSCHEMPSLRSENGVGRLLLPGAILRVGAEAVLEGQDLVGERDSHARSLCGSRRCKSFGSQKWKWSICAILTAHCMLVDTVSVPRPTSLRRPARTKAADELCALTSLRMRYWAAYELLSKADHMTGSVRDGPLATIVGHCG